ncbi:MAG: Gfo/Idh/MocA family protein [Coraliomargaritaceae bacterium]
MAFPTILPSRVFGEQAPSKQITIGCIGMGGQAQWNLKAFFSYNDCRVVSVCDAFLSRAKHSQKTVNEAYESTGCRVEHDFRELLADPTIDAVCISTPDHWHVPMSLMALKAGKDVFCEKPTHSIVEGRVLADAFSQSGKIFQAGIEDRSLGHFHKMVELVRNGAIGDLERVKVMMPQGRNHPPEMPSSIPQDLDWNLWQGPAAYHEYTPNRTRASHWRHIDMYSKGIITDIGTHLVDTAQLGVNDPNVCPVAVSGTGEIPEGRLTDVPITYDLNYTYSNGVEMNVYNGPAKGWDPKSCQLEFYGSRGWIKRMEFYGGLTASDTQILRTKYTAKESKYIPLPPREQRSFLDSVKSRKAPSLPAIDLHHMSTTLHMGVHSIDLGRPLKWNHAEEMYVDDDEANKKRFGPEPRKWENA